VQDYSFLQMVWIMMKWLLATGLALGVIGAILFIIGVVIEIFGDKRNGKRSPYYD